MSTSATAEDIRRLEMKIEELNASLTPVIALAVRRRSHKAQAKAVGCSP